MHPLVTFFLVGLVVPLILQFGPFRLSVYRLALLAAFVPCLAFWLSGRAGGYRLADLAVLLICAWSTLAAVIVHDLKAALEPSGILWLEALGAYLLARCFIRTAEAFHAMVRLIVRLVLVMLPFALWETVTAHNLVLELFGLLGPVYEDVVKAPRVGLDRVQGPFEHPILFGVFSGTGFALGFYVLGFGRRTGARLARSLPAGLAAATSLSSGPIISLMAQVGLIVWDRLLGRVRARWWVLAGCAGAGYATLALLSSRAPVVVIASHFAFNLQTAYSRVAIWEWGTRSVLSRPWFGIGFNDWERAPYMTESVDMFWMLPAMRHGIPVGALYLLFFGSVLIAALRAKGLDERAAQYRTGWAITMLGLFLAGWTVHFWNATFVLLMFLAGSGAWLAGDGRR